MAASMAGMSCVAASNSQNNLHRNLVEYYLSNYLYDTARFYAERLYYEDPSEANLNLWAHVYFRQGKFQQTYLMLKDREKRQSADNRYLFAQCCLALSADKHNDAEQALLTYKNPVTGKSEMPGGAAGYYLLGRICKHSRRTDAIRYFNQSLQLDPTLWGSIVQLGELGEPVDVSELFGIDLETAVTFLREDGRTVSVSEKGILGLRNVRTKNKENMTGNFSWSKSGDKVQAHTVPENRRFAAEMTETIVSEVEHTPRTAISLGMSSLSIRMPFASPGSVPSPFVSVRGLMAPVPKNKSLRSSKISFDSPRGALFETPGLTPINNTVNVSVNQSEGPSILTAVSGSAFRSTGIGLSIANDTRDDRSFSFASFKGHRVSFGGIPDLDDSTDGHKDALKASRLSFSSAVAAGDFREQLDTGNNTSDISFQETGRLLFSSVRSVDIGQSTGDESSLQESAHKIPRNGPTPEVAMTSANTHAKVKQAFEMSGLPVTSANETDTASADEKTMKIAALVTAFAGVHFASSSYRCRETVELAHNLPRCHFESGWVKHALGKAYFEMCEYKPAYIAFKDMVRLEPFRIEGIDILSTTLYHLRKDKDLSSLAQQVVDVDKMSPEAWCVVGNCFALQKETDTAIKFFERALQIDPSFTYAHTLCGHEMLSNEDLEKATTSYESALRYDGRHYNALFGLGTIAFRKENYKDAEHHFRKAISINPVSSKLQCHLGMTLHTQAEMLPLSDPQKSLKYDEALEVLSKASKMDPNNPHLRFQRFYVLQSMGNIEEALKDLEIVRDLSPREAIVYTKIGQIYYRMGRVNDAIRYFNVAVDLDPKSTATMKATLEGYDEESGMIHDSDSPRLNHEREEDDLEESDIDVDVDVDEDDGDDELEYNELQDYDEDAEEDDDDGGMFDDEDEEGASGGGFDYSADEFNSTDF